MMIIIVSVICTIFAISLIVYVSKSKMFLSQVGQKNSNGYYIIRRKKVYKNIANIMFVCSIFILWFAIGESSTPNDAIVILLLGIFYFIMGLFFMLVQFFERIEYNDCEISQYRIFRKHPKTILWNNTISIKLHNMGLLLELNSSVEKISVDLRDDNTSAFALLKFIQDKVKDKKIILIDDFEQT